MLAGIASLGPTTGFTKLRNIMDGTVHKRSARDTSCMMRASIAGTSFTNGGMKTATAGIRSGTGMIMTTTIPGITTTITNP